MTISEKTLFAKIWDRHVVVPETADTPAVLYIDLHLIHEVTSPQAFATLRERGLSVRRPERTLATADHSTPTLARRLAALRSADDPAALQVQKLEENCRCAGIVLHGIDSPQRGIVHVIGPELGATQPGRTIVCGDSHTSTHGAFGALAFGIGTTEVGHVLASQCLVQRRPRTMAINIEGRLAAGVTAKDLILAIIARIGVDGGTGHVLEYRGTTVRALTMDARMTLCNMSIEAGAKAGMIAPDDTTFEYLHGRSLAPAGADWDQALARWRSLPGDAQAGFERSIDIDAAALEPMISYGTNPGMAVPISGATPDKPRDAAHRQALDYMGLRAGEPLKGRVVDVVFVGSCTNSRIEDLRQAAQLLEGRHIAKGLRMLVVPGSQEIKRQAESEGLDRVFLAAGAEWRESGCSMCIAMNGDRAASGQTVVSTSNRNFEGRQGAGARTLLASPLTAAAAALAGCVADPRDYMRHTPTH